MRICVYSIVYSKYLTTNSKLSPIIYLHIFFGGIPEFVGACFNAYINDFKRYVSTFLFVCILNFKVNKYLFSLIFITWTHKSKLKVGC